MYVYCKHIKMYQKSKQLCLVFVPTHLNTHILCNPHKRLIYTWVLCLSFHSQTWETCFVHQFTHRKTHLRFDFWKGQKPGQIKRMLTFFIISKNTWCHFLWMLNAQCKCMMTEKYVNINCHRTSILTHLYTTESLIWQKTFFTPVPVIVK